MSDNRILTQEEINALLSGALEQPEIQSGEQPEEKPADVNEYLTLLEQDALGEIGNISLGNAATSLSILLGQEVDITTPTIEVLRYPELKKRFPKPHVAVNVDYTDGFQGMNLLVLKEEDAKIIADLMMGGSGVADQVELSELHLSAVQEAMNQMMGTAATSMSTLFHRVVNITPPGIQVLDLARDDVPGLSEEIIVSVSFQLKVGKLIDSNMMQLIPLSFAKSMVESLLGGVQEMTAASEPGGASTVAEAIPQGLPGTLSGPGHPGTPAEPAVAAAIAAEPSKPASAPEVAAAAQPTVQSFAFPAFPEEPAPQYNDVNLSLLMDIPLQVSVELGRTTKKINEILDLTNGSVVELDKMAGEPVDILVNNKLVARGEVVVIDENFAVRLTEIVNPNERIKSIKQ